MDDIITVSKHNTLEGEVEETDEIGSGFVLLQNAQVWICKY